MNLTEGSVVHDHLGIKYTLTSKLGEGAQGVVFHTDQDNYIVKLIHGQDDNRAEWVERFKWIMRQNIPKEARVAKPETLLEAPYVGYVMKKAQGHESLNHYLYKPVEQSTGEWYNKQTGSLKKRLEIALQVAKSFRRLHLEGLCYCDVSPNNILVARNVPSIVLIDADNLTSTNLFKSSILGTPRYIAPELFTLNKQPSSLTDTYSFAVVAFELLSLGHPLIGLDITDGTPEEEEAAVKGLVPYIDHPTDDSNRNNSILPRDIVLTSKLKALFEQTFVEGLHVAMKRPTLLEFINALQEALDSLVKCLNPLCQADFYATRLEEQACPWCDEVVEDICRVKIVETSNITDELFEDGKKKISLLMSEIILNNEARAIYHSHIESYVSPENDSIFALIKRQGDEILIKNVDDEKFFTVHTETRKQSLIEPQKIKTLERGKENVIIKVSKDLKELNHIFDGGNMIKAITFR